ncbi:MAG: dephospho-CoA kinase [Burkholderiaceae bacterium]|jgi:dephospho-CoA kinase|nr:dephospho-CoA kinase [Burkholderiaceae bacterium]
MPASEESRNPFFSIGLTGGIGSGKSTVAQLFASRGAGVVDTDEIAHGLTAPDGKAMPLVRREFGDAFISGDGSLNRARMRELVFQDPAARQRLEAILHPLIRQEAFHQAAALNNGYIIFVIPLLAEKMIWKTRVDRVLVVDCSEELQISRVMTRNGMSRAQVEAILAAQATREARKAIADDVIVNDNGLGHLSDEVARLDAAYKKLAEKWYPQDI